MKMPILARMRTFSLPVLTLSLAGCVTTKPVQTATVLT
jgi:hypothetical protein